MVSVAAKISILPREIAHWIASIIEMYKAVSALPTKDLYPTLDDPQASMVLLLLALVTIP